MKKKILKRLSALGMGTALAMGVLSGCGAEKTVDYKIEDVVSTEKAEAPQGKSSLTRFAEEEDWQASFMVKIGEMEWEGQVVDSMMTINIDAPITVPGTEEMSVVEVEEVEFDADWKRAVAENLFEEGQIYYWDVSHLPKKDLRDRQSLLALEDQMIVAADSYLVFSEEDEIYTRYENLQAAVDDMANAQDVYTPVEEYTVNEYIGSYEGRMYYLTFAETEGSRWNTNRCMRQIVCMVRDLKEVCPEKFREQDFLICSPWMRGDWIENRCEISEEEALDKAEEFVGQLGLDYPVYSYSRPLCWGRPSEYVTVEGETDDWGINGYVFYFDLGLDDLSFVQYGMEEDYRSFGENSDKNTLYSMKSQLQVYVTDKGVIRMIAENPMEITRVSEGVELLSLDTVKEIMQVTMHEKWEELSLADDYYYPFDAMELIYFRISDKENPGRYSYVPTWRLANVTRDDALHRITIRGAVLINAIDGNWIDFCDET